MLRKSFSETASYLSRGEGDGFRSRHRIFTCTAVESMAYSEAVMRPPGGFHVAHKVILTPCNRREERIVIEGGMRSTALTLPCSSLVRRKVCGVCVVCALARCEERAWKYSSTQHSYSSLAPSLINCLMLTLLTSLPSPFRHSSHVI